MGFTRVKRLSRLFLEIFEPLLSLILHLLSLPKLPKSALCNDILNFSRTFCKTTSFTSYIKVSCGNFHYLKIFLKKIFPVFFLILTSLLASSADYSPKRMALLDLSKSHPTKFSFKTLSSILELIVNWNVEIFTNHFYWLLLFIEFYDILSKILIKV